MNVGEKRREMLGEWVYENGGNAEGNEEGNERGNGSLKRIVESKKRLSFSFLSVFQTQKERESERSCSASEPFDFLFALPFLVNIILMH